jgi:hypothetical protein
LEHQTNCNEIFILNSPINKLLTAYQNGWSIATPLIKLYF